MTRRNLSHKSELVYDVHQHCVNIDTREIFLHSWLQDDEETGVDYRMAVVFEKNMRILHQLDKEKPILVHMHSIGGYWNDGMAIYDSVSFSSCPITILCYGHATSMSSVVLQAADQRIIMPNANFMLHYGGSAIDSNHISYISDAKWTEYLGERMLDIYVSRCIHGLKFDGWTEKRIRNYLDREMKHKQEVYLTAEESLDWGLVDGILGMKNYENIDKLQAE